MSRNKASIIFQQLAEPEYVIWSFDSEGHRGYHIMLLVTYLLERRKNVALVVMDSSAGAEKLKADFRKKVPHTVERKSDALFLRSSVRRTFASGSRRLPLGHLCLAGDRKFHLLLFFGASDSRVLLVRSPYAPRPKNFLKKIPMKVAIWFFSQLGCRFYHLAAPGETLEGGVNRVQDPSPFLLEKIENSDCERWSVPAGSSNSNSTEIRLGMFGVIGRRKQPNLLLHVATLVPNSVVRVVGKWESPKEQSEFVNLAETLGVPYELADRFQTDKEFFEQMQEVDLVAVFNTSEASSGIALGAIDLCKPLVFSGADTMRKLADAVDARWSPAIPNLIAEAIQAELAENQRASRRRRLRGDGSMPSLTQFAESLLS